MPKVESLQSIDILATATGLDNLPAPATADPSSISVLTSISDILQLEDPDRGPTNTASRRCGEIWGTKCKAWVQTPTWSHGLCPSPGTRGSSHQHQEIDLVELDQPELEPQLNTTRRRCGDVWGTKCKAWIQAPDWSHGLCPSDEVKSKARQLKQTGDFVTLDHLWDDQADDTSTTLVLPGGTVRHIAAVSPRTETSPRRRRSVLPLHINGAAARAPAVNPNTWAFIEYEMKPLAKRLEAGEDREAITEELFVKVLPWVLERVRRECSHLPTGADAQEIMSQMLTAAWRSASRYDPACPQSWPSALKQRLHGAWLEAYRTVDFVTRKHRTLHNLWRVAVEQEVNKLGRELTEQEKMEIALRVAPPTPAANWAYTIMYQTPPPALGGDVVGHEQVQFKAATEGDQASTTDDLAGMTNDPADTVCTSETAAGIDAWMTKLPARLQRAVRQALQENKPIPKAERAALGPWLPELMAKFADQEAANPLAVLQLDQPVVITGSTLWDGSVNASTVHVLANNGFSWTHLRHKLPAKPTVFGTVAELHGQKMVVRRPRGAGVPVNLLPNTTVYMLGA